jgi:glycosyltransferase involved in cell wall biosynthesis
MKVVVAHNRYVSAVPSGENMVVDADIAMLREAGVEVIPFIKDSDSLSSVGAKLKAATGPVWAPAVRELGDLLDREKPDVLHLHNVYPLISPWAVRTAKARGVAVVQTMHNYRHQCVAGQHLREGKICEDCTPTGLGLAAVRHACYRGSRVQSAAMVTGRAVHRSTWKMVDRYFVLSPFMADRLAAMGIDKARIVERPTSCPDPGPPLPPTGQRLLFVGRLEEAKGVPMLLEAWAASGAAERGWSLAFAGAGPLSNSVSEAANLDPSLRHLGQLSKAQLVSEYERSVGVLIPSTWFEGFPVVLAEAASHGRAVIASDIGSLGAAAAAAGALTTRASTPAWTEALRVLDSAKCTRSGQSLREYYKAHLSLATSVELLQRTYDAVAIAS